MIPVFPKYGLESSVPGKLDREIRRFLESQCNDGGMWIEGIMLHEYKGTFLSQDYLSLTGLSRTLGRNATRKLKAAL